jgi:hypothetical protein
VHECDSGLKPRFVVGLEDDIRSGIWNSAGRWSLVIKLDLRLIGWTGQSMLKCFVLFFRFHGLCSEFG